MKRSCPSNPWYPPCARQPRPHSAQALQTSSTSEERYRARVMCADLRVNMDFFTLVGLYACFYFLTYSVCLWCTDCNLELYFAEKFGRKLSSLRGEVVWITRVSTELGKAIALKVAQHRGKIILSSTSASELEKIKAKCLKVNLGMKSRDVFTLPFDIKQLATHEEALRKVIRRFGTVNILIMNEDEWERAAWDRTTPAAERLLFETNVFGVLSLARLAVGYFDSKGRGKLAVTSSIAGLIGVPFSSSYCGSKHGLHGYFNSLEIEKLGGNIQTTLLCLGSSEITQEKFSSSDKKFLEKDLKTLGSTKKMSAERCAHLCLTAVVNDLEEAWMAVFPILPLIYGIKYYPNVTKAVLKYLKPRPR